MLKGYITYISKAKKFKSRKVRIGPVARYILREFIVEPLSAYDILVRIKSRGKWSSYKNIHRRVHRLLSLNLIIKDKNFKSKRRTIKYRLTSEGIYYVLLHSPFLLGTDIVALFANYGEDDFFKILVYPFISKFTILKLYDFSLFETLAEYMRDCCYQLNARLDYEEESELLLEQPRDITPKRTPLMEVVILPLTIRLLDSCKYVQNEKDMKLLSNDIQFMKTACKKLKEYQAIHDNLKSGKRTVT